MTDHRRAVLDALVDADRPLDGAAVAESAGVDGTAVEDALDGLREAGVDLRETEAGHEVTAVPEYGWAGVAYHLDAPLAVEFHDALASSNDRARELAAAGAPETAVVAAEQTAARGRQGRAWHAPPGGVWLSVLVRPDLPPSDVPVLTLATAVAVTRAAREAGVDAAIKWPNDVLVGDRKLSGILTESGGVEWAVVGVGVNANLDPADLPEGATSVRAEGGDVDRGRFVARLLEELDALRSEPAAVLPAWREHARTLGRRVRVETPGGTVVGEAVDVAYPGALLVEPEDERRTVRVDAGDCEHLRPV